MAEVKVRVENASLNKPKGMSEADWQKHPANQSTFKKLLFPAEFFLGTGKALSGILGKVRKDVTDKDVAEAIASAMNSLQSAKERLARGVVQEKEVKEEGPVETVSLQAL